MKYMDKAHVLGAIIWPSFLCAGAATMFFFAMFDPHSLGGVTTWKISLTRLEGYSIGFLLFWIVTFTSSALTVLLLKKFSAQNA